MKRNDQTLGVSRTEFISLHSLVLNRTGKI